jgi:hypothetical protein
MSEFIDILVQAFSFVASWLAIALTIATAVLTFVACWHLTEELWKDILISREYRKAQQDGRIQNGGIFR